MSDQSLAILSAGPALSVQDLGRPGLAAQGLSRGGALDPLALWEAAVLLGLPAPVAAIEMPGMGGRFTATTPMRIALTGAPMQAAIDGRPVAWHAAHPLSPGQELSIGGALRGTTGYLTPGCGLATPEEMGSRAAHLAARIGRLLRAGDRLPVLADRSPTEPARALRPDPRFDGGTLRVLPGPQTALFTKEMIAAFEAARFTRGPRSNRQAIQIAGLSADAPAWHVASGGLASEPIQAGDIQITGDGTPFVLAAECQTIGGYPRIGSVHPEDMGLLVQCPAGAPLRFRFLDAAELAAARQPSPSERRRDIARRMAPLLRDPASMADLLSYQLISGVTAGDDLDRD